MYKQIAAVCLSVFLVGCSTTTKTKVAGSSYHFANYTHTIIAESLVSGLQVRLVRLSGGTSTCVSGTADHIELNGPIGPDSTYIVAKYLDMAQPCKNSDGTRIGTFVYLNSVGGFITDGMELGRLFRKQQVITKVMGDQKCASSCAVAFLGGTYRTMTSEAELIFHAPYRRASYGQVECASINEAKPLKSYYSRMVGKQTGGILFDRTMSYCGSTVGWVINTGAAMAYGILSF